MTKYRVTDSKKLFNKKDGYWFTTKSGKHIFVEKNKTLEDYKQEKIRNIEEKRNELASRISTSSEGERKNDALDKIYDDYYSDRNNRYDAYIGLSGKIEGKYLTKDGTFSKKFEDAYINKLERTDDGFISDKYYNRRDKLLRKAGKTYSNVDEVRVKKQSNAYINFDGLYSKEYEIANDMIDQAKYIRDFNFADAQIDDKEASKILKIEKEKRNTKARYNIKRAELLDKISNRLNKYYSKNPINVTDEMIENELVEKLNQEIKKALKKKNKR